MARERVRVALTLALSLMAGCVQIHPSPSIVPCGGMGRGLSSHGTDSLGEIGGITLRPTSYDEDPLIALTRDIAIAVQHSGEKWANASIAIDAVDAAIALDAGVLPYRAEARLLAQKFAAEFNLAEMMFPLRAVRLKAKEIKLGQLLEVLGLVAQSYPTTSGLCIVLRPKDVYLCRAYAIDQGLKTTMEHDGLPTYFPHGNNPRTARAGETYKDPCLAAWVPGTNVLLVITTPFVHSSFEANRQYDRIRPK